MQFKQRRLLATDPEICMFALIVSIAEPINIKEAMMICMDRSNAGLNFIIRQTKSLELSRQTIWQDDYKALKWLSQEEGIDLKKSFAPVARLEACFGILLPTTQTTSPFSINQMDVKDAFLNGPTEGGGLCCCSQTGFVDPDHPEKKATSQEALYGLKQAQEPGLSHPPVPKGIFINQAIVPLEIMKKHNMTTVTIHWVPLTWDSGTKDCGLELTAFQNADHADALILGSTSGGYSSLVKTCKLECQRNKTGNCKCLLSRGK
ncbi:retrovirus-related pol polyprotein from transposon TNT 1-94 [Tanacetum coccineum]